ncbi:sigma-70 family RNA polymerase sigma factor [Microvirga arabica]|uniref:sigma-70 family RNA polymerase sigma factor n=1 Tax=Microvirga arabica TaxID=1128671 RepID=UPI001939B22F|nr:sigma-70 family RNA polymerase sigma factor [Microvirga arabica]MBM1170571.1 sigma-70 family RNA polymerase sigma factor [Microvirga arabica]
MTEHEEAWASAMRSANRGDADAYARLLSDVARALRRVIAYDSIRLGLGGTDVEDVLQDALLAIHLKRHTWDETRPIVPWLRAIAHYKALDHARRSGRRVSVPIESVAEIIPAPEPEPELPASTGRFLEMLPRRQREVLEALALDGASIREAAERLKMSEGAVRVALHRGLAALAAKLGGSE